VRFVLSLWFGIIETVFCNEMCFVSSRGFCVYAVRHHLNGARVVLGSPCMFVSVITQVKVC